MHVSVLMTNNNVLNEKFFFGFNSFTSSQSSNLLLLLLLLFFKCLSFFLSCVFRYQNTQTEIRHIHIYLFAEMLFRCSIYQIVVFVLLCDSDFKKKCLAKIVVTCASFYSKFLNMYYTKCVCVYIPCFHIILIL